VSTEPPPGPPEGWQRPQQQGWGQPPPGAQGPPTQPQWGQPPPPQPPKPKPPLYRRPWFIIVGVLVLIVIAGAFLGDPPAEEPTGAQPEATQAPGTQATQPEATEPPATEPPTTEPPATEPQTDVGNPVRDGDFEFAVSAFGCRAGECKATRTIENIGNQPGTMFASNQYLYDDQGRQFAADDSLTDALFLEELNPGQRVRGIIVWKVGSGTKADHLELHDSAFSGGVEVKV
jgi:hypothetical protein